MIDELQNQRIDSIESRLTALETIIIEVRANARMLKGILFSVAGLAGLTVSEFMI